MHYIVIIGVIAVIVVFQLRSKPLKNNLFIITTIILAFILSLSACKKLDRGRGPLPPPPPTVPIKPEPPKVVPPAPVVVQPNYNPEVPIQPIPDGRNLPTPPKILFQKPSDRHTRQDFIDRYNITGEMKELIVACDYDNSTVRNTAVLLGGFAPGEFNLGQVCEIFDYGYNNWKYVNDPVTEEYFSKASETLKNGLNGDCDDFAILLCSMILAIGGEARINFAYDATSGHAFTEVNIGKTNQSEVQRYMSARYNNAQLWHRKDNQGNIWMNLDWQAGSPGGKYWEYSGGTSFNIIRNLYERL